MIGTINHVSKFPTKDFLHSSPVDLSQYLSLLLRSIFQSRSLRKGIQIHAQLISSGGVSLNKSHHVQKILSELTSMYVASGDIVSARQLFNGMSLKTTFLKNRVIKGYGENGLSLDALHLFCQMGDQPSDSHTFTFSLKACADLGVRENVVRLHCRAIVEGFQLDGYVQNSLISSYMRCGDRESAEKVFDRIHSRTKTVVSWSAMISGLVENGRAKEALRVFDKMIQSSIIPGCSTVISVLPACASTKDLRRGRTVHKITVQNGYIGFLPARNSLIDMYMKCGRLDVARKLFDERGYDRDVVSWTAMIAGYIAADQIEESLVLTNEMMLSSPWKPNAVTMTAILSSCSIRHGKSIHGLCIRLHLVHQLIVEASLLEMYSRCGEMEISLILFANCSQRPGTWNQVISCYRRNGLALSAINHFKQMLLSGVRPNDTTIMSILPAYSETNHNQAKSLHCYVIKTGFAASTEAVTGLINLYSKFGSLPTAWELFDELKTEAKDVVVWSSIINGYGMHGHAETAIELLNQMIHSGIEPNEITYTTILHSCSHAGLVDEGLNLLERLRSTSYTSEGHHYYSCIIDLLGRANRLDEARKLIPETTQTPAVWGALLGACAVHGNVELGEEAGQRLFQLEPENTGNYILLGNLYAASGRWDEAAAVRKKLKQKGLQKQPGCSRNSF
ncbi:Pentatricopeptide repeat-containing protein [Zostera marina]|uniref:Pentatricopeptide repeat-containing protein n=1 Tax=Zostera marina TaxID=29655 RepID=A0A0K9Q1M5_ZOSMR|nr:Pentatricopeptide repeat-containing protein [Zostera marina]